MVCTARYAFGSCLWAQDRCLLKIYTCENAVWFRESGFGCEVFDAAEEAGGGFVAGEVSEDFPLVDDEGCWVGVDGEHPDLVRIGAFFEVDRDHVVFDPVGDFLV